MGRLTQNRRGTLREAPKHERIGIFGGTFDPPHLGHLILAESAISGFDLSRVLFVPNGDPPHKRIQDVTPVVHRLAMLQLAVQDNPRFEISRIEIDHAGPYYTYETIRRLKEQMPTHEMIFLLGGDSLRDLPTWHNPEDILKNVQIGVMQRAGERLYMDVLIERLPAIEDRVTIMEAPEIGIAARALRRLNANGKSIRYQVPDAVIAYIHQHGLYEEE